MNVAILGASSRPERFSFRAQQQLMAAGHSVFPVSRSGESILGCRGFRSMAEFNPEDPIHTVTVYLNPQNLASLADEVIQAAPARVIFNPGTESPEWERRFEEAGIEVINDCTLVMLERGTF